MLGSSGRLRAHHDILSSHSRLPIFVAKAALRAGQLALRVSDALGAGSLGDKREEAPAEETRPGLALPKG